MGVLHSRVLKTGIHNKSKISSARNSRHNCMSSHNDNLTQAVSIEVLLSGLVSESLDPLVHCSAIKIP